MKQNLIKKALLVLIKELQRVLRYFDLLGARKELNQAQVDPLEVDLGCCEDFLCDVVGLFVDAGELDHFGRREVSQYHSRRPDAEVLEKLGAFGLAGISLFRLLD